MSLVILITGSLTFLSIKREQNSYYRELKEQANLFLDTIDTIVRNPLYLLKADTISRQVNTFKKHQEILGNVWIFDGKGRLMIEAKNATLEFNTAPNVMGKEIITQKEIKYHRYPDYIIAAKPVMFGQQTVGAIAIKLSTKPLEKKIAKVRQQGIIIALIAGSGGILVAILLSRSLTAPLDQLVQATHRISQGDLSQRINLKNRDEFSLLAQEFNNMSEWLEQILMKYEKTNAKLQYDISHDSLTGLANRVFILGQIEAAIQQTKDNPDDLFAVLFLDCDRFKIINDSLGHDVGDQVLIAIAQRLTHCIRKGDIAARLGGDEFVILLKNIKDIDEVTRIAERILKQLSEPLSLESQHLVITMSIGVVLSQTEYNNPDDLLRDADLTMYHAKQQGKAQYAVFQPIMHKQALERLALETSLRYALENKEFHLYYQPIICLQTSQLVGFEALLRWHHPTQGWISPSTFIPIAEETGLILTLGDWILQEACHQISLWQSHFTCLTPLKISVNISSHQIAQPNFVETVERILQTTRLNANQLNLEITETVLMNHIETACFKLQCLQALGVKISIDDFGTGYSSLNYLQQLPIDILKIDRSFVARLQSNSSGIQIIKAIITLADVLGMKTLAEGVETPEQYHLITSLAADYAQGFLFSKPLNKPLVEQLLYSLSDNPSDIWNVDDYVKAIA